MCLCLVIFYLILGLKWPNSCFGAEDYSVKAHSKSCSEFQPIKKKRKEESHAASHARRRGAAVCEVEKHQTNGVMSAAAAAVWCVFVVAFHSSVAQWLVCRRWIMTGQCHACDCRLTEVWITKSIRGSIFTDQTEGVGQCHVRQFVVYERPSRCGTHWVTETRKLNSCFSCATETHFQSKVPLPLPRVHYHYHGATHSLCIQGSICIYRHSAL